MAVGDSNLFFSRDTKVYISQGSGTTQKVWEVPVLNGYSFAQSTNASTVTLNEMSDATGRSRRGQRVFNDSVSPAEWSFDTYARPTVVSTKHRAPEEALWAALLSESNFNPVLGDAGVVPSAGVITVANYVKLTLPTVTGEVQFKPGDYVTVTGVSAAVGTTAASGTFIVTASDLSSVTYFVPGTAVSGIVTLTTPTVKSATFTSGTTALDFFGTSSNKTTLGTFDLYFVLGANKAPTVHNYATDDVTTIYKIAGACVNEATMNFEIDGIATISWSGMGRTVSELATLDFISGAFTGTLYSIGITSTSNMIRNRLTALNAVGVTPNAKTYGITLTGGSITISNNMTFLTPEVLGVVNQPLGHVTGSRSVSGSFTCYLDEATNGSIDLYQDLLNATTTITNNFNLDFFVGGKGSDGLSPMAPGVMIDLGQCHLEIPTVNIDDVIGLEVTFTALPSTISNTDEIGKIRYVGV